MTTGKSMIPVTTLFNGNDFRASIYENGIAATANKIVPAMEVQIVSQILFLTSASPAVSKRLTGLVFMNIPTSGARIKSNTRAPRKRKVRFMEERRDTIFTNYDFLIIISLKMDSILFGYIKPDL